MAAAKTVYCVQCGVSLLSTFTKCPSCGAREFSDTPGSPHIKQEPPSTSPPKISTPPPAQAYAVRRPQSLGQSDHGVSERRYAGFWIRVGATLIDGLIFMAALIPFSVFWRIGFGLSWLGFPTFEEILFFEMLISIALPWLYCALLESSELQATLGKRALGLKVIDGEGQRISFGRATGRYFGKTLSSLPLCAGYLMVAFTKKNQGLHDVVASTFVLRT